MGDSFTQMMTFDAMNRPTTQTAPNLQTTAFTYGKGSLLDRVSIDGSAYLTNIAYNARGQRTDVWFANGSKTRYEYDSDTFRLTRLLTTRNSGVDVLQDVTYTYDPEGNIVQQSDAAQQTYYFNNSVVSPTGLYEYDALYRLIKAQGRELTNLGMATESDFVNTLSVPNAGSNAMQNYTQMFSYDELGNLQTMQSQGRWSRSYIYDNVTNRLLRHEGTTNVYTYDAHGNMTSIPHLSSMTWNSSDMLRSATNGTFTSYYSYNAAGDRVRKVVEKGNIREERLYLGNYERYRKYVNNILKTERQTVHIIDDRHRFASMDRLTINNGITLATATNSIRYQYDNHLSSASLELDQTAAIISYEEYHPFGTTSYRSGRTETEVSQKRYKYVGKERDEETGLYYYGARYYAAWLFRFVSVDPLQFKYPHYTPYQYAGNKPVSYIDLDGLEEAKNETITPTGTLYIDKEGNQLGNNDSEERRIFVVYSENVLSSLKKGESIDFSSLSQDEMFELPTFEMRQEIKKQIEAAGYSKDMWGNLIADFEIGGFIQYCEEWKGPSSIEKVGSGFYNRMRIQGNIVKNNYEQATLSQEVDLTRDPVAIAKKNGRTVVVNGTPQYSWHVHLNVFFDKQGFKRSYQWVNFNDKMDSATLIGANWYSGERKSEPSEQDMENTKSLYTNGIVVDMIGNVHIYNSKRFITLKENIFFNTK